MPTFGNLIRVMASPFASTFQLPVRCQKSDRSIRDRHHVLKPSAAIPKFKLRPEHGFGRTSEISGKRDAGDLPGLSEPDRDVRERHHVLDVGINLGLH
jgi:hypothetical protein